MPVDFDSKAFMAKINSMSSKVNDDIIKKNILKGAKIIKDEMIKNAPLGETGDLKKNIIITEFQKDKDGQLYVNVGPHNKKAFYARYLEFGTTKMKARPFIEPSFLSKRKEALEAISTAMKGEIESV